MASFTIDVLGRWSYAFCVSLSVVLLIGLLRYFRHTFRFAVWRFYMTITVNTLPVDLRPDHRCMAGDLRSLPEPSRNGLRVVDDGFRLRHHVGGLGLEPELPRVVHAPAFWLWVGLMAVGFLPAWEAFHIGIDGDWRWNIENTFPAAYTFRGASLPFHEFFGYVTSATTFQALMFFYIRRFGAIVIRDASLVPFSRV